MLEPHQNPKSAGIMAVILVVVLALAAYMFANQTAEDDTAEVTTQTATPAPTVNSTAAASPTTTATPSPTPVTTTTYTNTKYGYSFEYPATGFELTGSAGNADDLAISPTADAVNVNSNDGIVGNGPFSISIPGIELTPTDIKAQFGSTKAENITVTAMTIGGNSGYKAVMSGDSSVISNFYYVKTKSGSVLQLVVVNSSSDAQAMLKSFKITN